MESIAVIDYGMGNLRSVSKAVEHVAPNAKVVVTHDVSIIREADRVVCPGQGAAAACMQALQAKGLTELIQETASTRPFFGICMGLQVLLTYSDENEGVPCLDVLPGKVHRFNAPLLGSSGERLKVPHMGWSCVERKQAAQAEHPLWYGIEEATRFYFAHSYYCAPESADVIAANTDYGQRFAVALAKDSLFACQFHPEKSSAAGLQLLANFVAWDGQQA